MIKKRTLFIGDVHGCLDELKLLLIKAKYKPDFDRLIYLGDILNKGPKSVETLKFIREQKVECILGNNELGFLDAARNGSDHGATIKDLIYELKDELDDFCCWIETFPAYIEGDDFIAVHAGIEPGKTIQESSRKVQTTIRTWDGLGKNLNNPSDPEWYDLYEGSKTIIYGHYAARGLMVRDKTIGLDSGCVFGGELSGLIWPSREIVQVKAHKEYLKVMVKKAH